MRDLSSPTFPDNMTPYFSDIRALTTRALTLAVAVVIAANLLVSFAAAQPSVGKTLAAVQQATGGLIQGPLVVAPIYLVIVGTAIFGVGRLRPSDVGWRWSDVAPALCVTLAFWVVMQFGLALWLVAVGDELRWNTAWNEPGLRWFAGQLLAQLLGNALLEEMVFRGFLLPQFHIKASAHLRPVTALALALVASQAMFSLLHIPDRLLVRGWPVEALAYDQLDLIVGALIYSTVYLVTRNLFVCVGLHSLWNQPARLVQIPFSPGVMVTWYVLVLILLVGWFLATRKKRCG